MAERAGRALLQVVDVSHSFGGVAALCGFNLAVREGMIRGIIGPNGAGKSTAFNLVSGVYRPDAGRVELGGENVTGLPSPLLVAKGISRTFQNIRLFKSMTVLDNVRTAAYTGLGYPVGSAMLRTLHFRRRESELRQTSVALLEKLGLGAFRNAQAVGLPYALQRKVELARALISRPRVLLLDEPGVGTNPTELEALAELILWVRDEFSLAIVLIEHRLRLVMRACELVTVLNHGHTIFEGSPGGLAEDERVRKAYLGEEYDAPLG